MKRLYPYTNNIIVEAREAMKKDSYFLMPNIYSTEFCEEIKTDMDKIDSGLGIEKNFGNTETRIWSAQKRFKCVKTFFDDSNLFLSSLLKQECVAGTVLAIKNTPLPAEGENHTVGRWHIDSWRPQEKVFLFLSDTSVESGPFEFILNTNKTFFRLRKALEPGFFFNHFSMLKKSSVRRYASIPENKISSLLNRGYKTKQVLVKAGTVMVINSSNLIHRARPCKKVNRYALTAYYKTAEGYHDYDV